MVLNQIATLQEIETHWSLDDVFDANEGVDAIKEAEYNASKRK